jgi:hypothetical protein
MGIGSGHGRSNHTDHHLGVNRDERGSRRDRLSDDLDSFSIGARHEAGSSTMIPENFHRDELDPPIVS